MEGIRPRDEMLDEPLPLPRRERDKYDVGDAIDAPFPPSLERHERPPRG
jgi:hypothetical protein